MYNYNDTALVKLSSSGQLLWAQSFLFTEAILRIELNDVIGS